MSYNIGMDIGGTKIAAALFGENGVELDRHIAPTPTNYDTLLDVCVGMVDKLDPVAGGDLPTIGVGLPGVIDPSGKLLPQIVNVPCLSGKNLRHDLEMRISRPVPLANDANCAALSEAYDGAGVGCRRVFGLIIGTGVGGGFVVDGRLMAGANGIAGEVGHLPLPFREDSDGPVISCACGQKGCIDKTISGPALGRLHRQMTGKEIEIAQLCAAARADDAEALKVLDSFYTTVAKAMITIIHTLDPDIIIVSGGLSDLPGFYEAVPKRWGPFSVYPNLRTKISPSKHGALSGLRGAARLGVV